MQNENNYQANIKERTTVILHNDSKDTLINKYKEN